MQETQEYKNEENFQMKGSGKNQGKKIRARTVGRKKGTQLEKLSSGKLEKTINTICLSLPSIPFLLESSNLNPTCFPPS